MHGESVLCRMLSKLWKQINIKKHHKEIIRDYTFNTFDSNHVKDRDKNDELPSNIQPELLCQGSNPMELPWVTGLQFQTHRGGMVAGGHHCVLVHLQCTAPRSLLSLTSHSQDTPHCWGSQTLGYNHQDVRTRGPSGRCEWPPRRSIINWMFRL